MSTIFLRDPNQRWEKMIELSKENYESNTTGKTPAVVDFWAEWCSPCRTLNPILEELSEEMKGKIKFCKVNMDENPELASQQHITSVPTVLIYKDGSVVDQFTGAFSKEEIKKKLESILG